MTEFEKTYNRLFMLRGADTKHMNDCELIWIAAMKAEREACAKTCEALKYKHEYVRECSAAIRKRSNV